MESGQRARTAAAAFARCALVLRQRKKKETAVGFLPFPLLFFAHFITRLLFRATNADTADTASLARRVSMELLASLCLSIFLCLSHSFSTLTLILCAFMARDKYIMHDG